MDLHLVVIHIPTHLVEPTLAWAWDGGDLATTSDTTNYNQSEVWSTFGDSNAKTNENWTHVFDGSETAAPHVVANSGSTTVWTPLTPITFTKLEIYANNDGYGNITLNGSISTTGTVPSGGGSSIGWANVTSLISNNTLTSIEVPNSYNSDPTRLGAIKVDDKYLVDPGVITAGSLNSSVYDSSQTWSSFGSSGTYSSTYDWTKMFAGDINGRTIPANGQSITADFSSLYGGGIAYTSSFKLYYRRNTNAPDVKVNGSGISATADGTNRVYELTGSGLITSVGTAQRTAAGSGDCSLRKIEIDGKILLDNGVTPVDNFPTIASTVRANPSAGFSIVTYTATGSPATIGHGLNAAPGFIVVKSRTNSDAWPVYHQALSNPVNQFLGLHSTDAVGSITITGAVLIQM